MSTFVDVFKRQLLPGNYFLTKSMELSKLEDSGTLWYTKKFIVLYYYIFLKNNITNTATAREICDIFDSYIDSMPASMQAKAKDYFYCSQPTADLRSSSFKFFDAFAGTVTFQNPSDEIAYREMAKKYYMAFLMESGGQAGVKKHIKDEMYKAGFCFSQIDNIINSFGIPSGATLTSIKNDFMAFVRNERQILFYYGFFHSKSLGANDREFSSLTPVGKLSIKATYFDLIALWEHQKLKMVSQPVTCDIQNLAGLHADPSKFMINRSPYLTLLYWLRHRQYISLTEYAYLASRTSTVLTPSQMDDLVANLDDIGQVVEGFNRRGDKKNSADYLKELKKYFLGIWELKEDKGDNPFVVCEYKSRLNPSEFRVTNQTNLASLVSLYSLIDDYKLREYKDVLDAGEVELRRQYETELSPSAENPYKINPRVKIDWDLYNIHVDSTIMSGILVALVHIISGARFEKKNLTQYVNECFAFFPETLKFLGMRRPVFKKLLSKILAAFKQNDCEILLSTEKRETSEVEVKEYSADASAGTLVKIKEESNKETITVEGERKRNMTLIALIRTYNNAVNLSNGELLCECCHQPTFLTEKDHTSYVEYHHLIPFNICEGPDHYLNIYALCPMCHMKMHHMVIDDKAPLYRNLALNNYLHLSIEDRLKSLKNIGKITSYHLEYLLADNAITNAQYERILA